MDSTIKIEQKKRTLVIGLDGATWDLMKPWAEEGILPTFKKLMENGVYGNLESTIPPVTIPAWISFATGKNPGKLGCPDFLLPKKSLNDTKPITTKDIQEKTFYEILYENGKKCILINLPGSYPPKIKEIVITSIMTQGDDFIFPSELVNEIQEFKNYRIVPSLLAGEGNSMDYINDVRQLEKNRFECAKKLFEKDWDFFFLLFSATDWIQHQIYDKLVSGIMNENSDPIKAYKEIDKYIEWFVDNLPQDVNVLLMSDHGFKVYKKAFFINDWLMKKGYLKVEPTLKTRPPSNKLEERDEKLKPTRIKIKLPIFLSKYLKLSTMLFPLYKRLKKIISIEISHLQPKLSETIAYSMTHSGSNFGGIYINDKKRFIDGIVEYGDYENIRTGIMNKLKNLKDKDENAIIKRVWKKEDIYFGYKLDIAPDIIFMLFDKYHVMSNLTKPFVVNNNQHALSGVFLACGLDIKNGKELRGLKLIDLAPTILHMFNIPIPKDMDGRVLKEIFKEDSELAKREIKYQEEVDEKEIVKEKIKKLKVIGKI